jgi:hypothetical protein
MTNTPPAHRQPQGTPTGPTSPGGSASQRVPRGTPAGGRFAATARTEADVTLTPTAPAPAPARPPTFTRSAVDRLLGKHLTAPRSRVARNKIYDWRTEGWYLSWTKYGRPEVQYSPGNISVAYHPDADGAKQRACLDQVERVLTEAGYAVEREDDRVTLLDPADRP